MAVPAVFGYNRYTDNVAPLATWAAEASADSGYPATNIPLLNDVNLGNPGKLTIKTAGGWTADFGSAQRIDNWLLWHDADAGQTVQIQGHTSNSWGTPEFSATFTLPAVREDGYHVKLYADLTTKLGASFGSVGYNTTGWRWWRIHFPVAGANNSQNWGLKAMAHASNRSLDRALLSTQHMPEHHTVLKMKTDFGYFWRYDLQDAPRSLVGTVISTKQGTSWADILSWYRDAKGSYRPFLLVPDLTTAEGWIVRFDDVNASEGLVIEEMDVQLISPGINPISLRFAEVSGGGPEWT